MACGWIMRTDCVIRSNTLSGLRQTAPRAYVVAEKILQREERLQAGGWPIHGCTGYEFIDAANGLLLCPEGLSKIEEFYREFNGRDHWTLT